MFNVREGQLVVDLGGEDFIVKLYDEYDSKIVLVPFYKKTIGGKVLNCITYLDIEKVYNGIIKLREKCNEINSIIILFENEGIEDKSIYICKVNTCSEMFGFVQMVANYYEFISK